MTKTMTTSRWLVALLAALLVLTMTASGARPAHALTPAEAQHSSTHNLTNLGSESVQGVDYYEGEPESEPLF